MYDFHLPIKFTGIRHVRPGIDSHKISAPSVPGCVCANNLCFELCVFQEPTQLSRLLSLFPSSCEKAVKVGSSLKPLKKSDSSACSARMQGAIKTGLAPKVCLRAF